AHAEVPHGFAEMGRQVLLPSLAVADLMALSEAVAVGVDTAPLAGIHESRPRPIGLDGRKRCAVVDAVRGEIVAQNIAQLGIEAGPARAAQESFDRRWRDGARPQVLFERRSAALRIGRAEVCYGRRQEAKTDQRG